MGGGGGQQGPQMGQPGFPRARPEERFEVGGRMDGKERVPFVQPLGPYLRRLFGIPSKSTSI